MTLKDVCELLNITKYPDCLEKYYRKPHPVSLCDDNALCMLEKEYKLFGEFSQKISECISEIRKSDALLAYANASIAYIYENGIPEAKALPCPTFSDNTPLSYYRGAILASLMPSAIESYKARGFSQEEIHATLDSVMEKRIKVAEENNQKSGVDASAFFWLIFYAKSLVFYNGLFNITPKIFDDKAVILKNKNTGEIMPFICETTLHKNGGLLGSAGFVDEEGKFEPDFIECDEYFEGYKIEKALVTHERVRCYKDEWEKIAYRGSGIAGIHIPRGASIAPNEVEEKLRLALHMTKKHYPEFNATAVYCASWMLDPKLEELLGAESKLVRFMKKFISFPRLDYGGAIFEFVFKNRPLDYNDLPENTSLQRKMKQLYLDGGYIYAPGGVAILD